MERYDNYLSSNSSKKDSKKSFNLKKSDFLSPPVPLIQRKSIPLHSPKFGKHTTYIKLNPFYEAELEEEKINFVPNINSSSITGSTVESRFEKNCNINLYINSISFVQNLVFLKNEKNKENKISIDNIVNFKKKAETVKFKPKSISPYYELKDSSDDTLLFESRFESGNLLAASKISTSEYHLVLQNDTNTIGYSQWFYFRVSNTRKGNKVKFNIINQSKRYSLYNKGMRILVYSEKKFLNENIGWHRSGTEIDYYRNGLYKLYKEGKGNLSSLIFTIEFEYNDDTVYFANTLPYTYTDLNRQLNEFERDESKFPFVIRKNLCSTLAGNNLDILTITSKNDREDISNRPGIVIMARVHPGETVSSWMMRGVLDFLTSNHEDAEYLRKNYVFKIVPMMNPDGVIAGNYRTSFAGCDLNRRWLNPSEILHPEVFSVKNMILKFAKTREIALISDLHGHSGLHNIFMYGNYFNPNDLSTRVFPFILSKINKSFYYDNCSFKMPKSKQGCARINLFNELNITNIFTMEASFSGCKYGGYENLHFNSRILKEMGRDLCKSILIYKHDSGLYLEMLIKSMEDKNSSRIKKEESKGKLNENSKEKQNLSINNPEKEDDDDSGGSDSEPSVDNLDKEDLFKLLPNFAKKKKITKKKKPSFISKKTVKPKEEQKIEKQEIKPKDIPRIKSIVSSNTTNLSSVAKESVNFESSQNNNVNNIIPVEIKKPVEKPIVKPPNTVDKIVINEECKKKDAETQTEDIFFKMPWTFFKAKNYKILTSDKSRLNENKKRVAASLEFERKLYQGSLNYINGSDTRRNVFENKSIKKELSSTKNILGNNLNKMFKITNNTSKFGNAFDTNKILSHVAQSLQMNKSPLISGLDRTKKK